MPRVPKVKQTHDFISGSRGAAGHLQETGVGSSQEESNVNGM